MKYLSVIVIVLGLAACDDCAECGDSEELFAPDGSPSEGCDIQECDNYCSNELNYWTGYCITHKQLDSNRDPIFVATCQCVDPKAGTKISGPCMNGDQVCNIDNTIYICIDNQWKLEVDCNQLFDVPAACRQYYKTTSSPFQSVAECSGSKRKKYYEWCAASEVEECENEYENCDSEINDCEGSRCLCLELVSCWDEFDELSCSLQAPVKECTDSVLIHCENEYNICTVTWGEIDYCKEERCGCLDRNNCTEQFNELGCSSS